MPRRIAILGAGPAALTAAWYLSGPNLEEKNEITLYQAGWRAGGLCSSGRVGPQQWINQNGTHYIFGCYTATLRVLKEAFDVLDAHGDTRFGTFEAQLIPRDLVAIRQMFQGGWTDWLLPMARQGGDPGGEVPQPEPHESWVSLTRFTLRLLRSAPFKEALSEEREGSGEVHGGLRRLWEGLEERVEGLAEDALSSLLHEAELALERLLLALDDSGHAGMIDWLAKLLGDLRAAIMALLGPLAEDSVTASRFAFLADLGLTVAIGGLLDRAFTPAGLEALDAIDFRAWLLSHGARLTSVWSPVVAVWYDSIAAYKDGRPDQPLASTSATLISIGRLMSYAHAFAYQLAWEAGDSVIGPIVAALQYRGVKLVFFHRVWDIVPSADGRRIDVVHLERQLELKNPDPASYQPFIDSVVPGRVVWPDEPRWEVIKSKKPEQWVGGLCATLLPKLTHDPADAPRATAGLESSLYPRLGPPVVLRADQDFDVLIGAMGLPMYPMSAPSLLAASSAFRRATERIGGGETQSLRLWFYPTLEKMGWTTQAPILSAYAAPFCTWEDPSNCLASESWRSPPPQTVCHLFGALPEKKAAERRDDYLQSQVTAVYLTAAAWTEYTVGTLWPGVAQMAAPLALDPTQTAAIQIRANVGLEQLYTQILPGTAAYRPSPGLTEYENFAICGDWTKTRLMTGCVEGAVDSGISVAKALSCPPALGLCPKP